MAQPFVRVTCPKCQFTTAQEAKLNMHLLAVHGVAETSLEQLFLDTNNMQPQLCECGCKDKVAWNGWKKGYTSRYLRGHNALLTSVYSDKTKSAELAAARKASYESGRVAWNKGLSKSSDDRVARQGNRARSAQRAALQTSPRKLKPQPVAAALVQNSYPLREEVLEFVQTLDSKAESSTPSTIVASKTQTSGLVIELIKLVEGTKETKRSIIANDMTVLAEPFGDVLFRVYEDDWRDRKEIVKGMIRHRMGVYNERFDARKLKVVQLPPGIARGFFDSNHIDGYAPSKVTFALVDDNDRVLAASSLRRPFHKSHGDVLEVARSASLQGVVVRGWLGRLTKALATYARALGKKSIMTYVDSRVGAGVGYERSGWKLVKRDTGARFWWTDGVNRFDRFRYKADKLTNRSQNEVAAAAGVVQLFGSGNSLWKLEL